jgi:hypothetical protein
MKKDSMFDLSDYQNRSMLKEPMATHRSFTKNASKASPQIQTVT